MERNGVFNRRGPFPKSRWMFCKERGPSNGPGLLISILLFSCPPPLGARGSPSRTRGGAASPQDRRYCRLARWTGALLRRAAGTIAVAPRRQRCEGRPGHRSVCGRMDGGNVSVFETKNDFFEAGNHRLEGGSPHGTPPNCVASYLLNAALV